jgi:hypothetical protein
MDLFGWRSPKDSALRRCNFLLILQLLAVSRAEGNAG